MAAIERKTGRERVRDPTKPRRLGGKRVKQPDPLPQQAIGEEVPTWSHILGF
jgi:hypothetical protein